jgi:hypothetical protein
MHTNKHIIFYDDWRMLSSQKIALSFDRVERVKIGIGYRNIGTDSHPSAYRDTFSRHKRGAGKATININVNSSPRLARRKNDGSPLL